MDLYKVGVEVCTTVWTAVFSRDLTQSIGHGRPTLWKVLAITQAEAYALLDKFLSRISTTWKTRHTASSAMNWLKADTIEDQLCERSWRLLRPKQMFSETRLCHGFVQCVSQGLYHDLSRDLVQSIGHGRQTLLKVLDDTQAQVYGLFDKTLSVDMYKEGNADWGRDPAICIWHRSKISLEVLEVSQTGTYALLYKTSVSHDVTGVGRDVTSKGSEHMPWWN